MEKLLFTCYIEGNGGADIEAFAEDHSQVADVMWQGPCLSSLELTEEEKEGASGPGQGGAGNEPTISRVHYRLGTVSWKDSTRVAIF